MIVRDPAARRCLASLPVRARVRPAAAPQAPQHARPAHSHPRGSLSAAFRFVPKAGRDYAARLGPVASAEAPEEAARWTAEFDQVVTPCAPMGRAREVLDALPVPVLCDLRPFDAMCWPHAAAGFSGFRDRIPGFVGGLQGLRAA